MKITKEQVESLAALVRLELKEKEKEDYRKDISSILDMVEKLGEVKVSEVDSEAPVLKNVLAEDKAAPSELSRDELLKNAPMMEKGAIKVRKVLE